MNSPTAHTGDKRVSMIPEMSIAFPFRSPRFSALLRRTSAAMNNTAPAAPIVPMIRSGTKYFIMNAATIPSIRTVRIPTNAIKSALYYLCECFGILCLKRSGFLVGLAYGGVVDLDLGFCAGGTDDQ